MSAFWKILCSQTFIEVGFGGRLRSLSAGMQQVADLPFMLSEWVHVFPTQYVFEGPAIIGAYGMGLQGWDVSYLFQNRDPGGYLPKLGADKWVFAQPEVLGIFPAISRQVLRQDVKESDLVATRSVHVPSLHEGKLGFDDQVRQGYDDKSFDSKTVPVESIAAVRSVVAFEDEYAVMEPVKATVRIQREGNPVVHVLDHDGRRTGRTVAVAEDGRFEVDGSATQAVYYEIDYTGETPRQE